MITAIMHLVTLSIFMGLLSMFGIHLWTWLPAIASITITIHLLVMNSYFKRLMEGLLNKYSGVFDDPEEIEIMKTSPGVFIPQVTLITGFARLDMAASLGWVRILSIIAVILGIIFKNYVVVLIGVLIFIMYLFSGIGGMFYFDNPEANMFLSVRRYLSKKKMNVKSMSDTQLEYYAMKYQGIVTKLQKIYRCSGSTS